MAGPGRRSCPTSVLAALTASATSAQWGSVRVNLALCALAAAWMLMPLHPALRKRPPVMAVFVTGLIVISFVLVIRDPWFGFLRLRRVRLCRSGCCPGRGSCPASPRWRSWRPRRRRASVNKGDAARPRGLRRHDRPERAAHVRHLLAPAPRRERRHERTQAGAGRAGRGEPQARGDAGRERGPARSSCWPRPGRPGSWTSGSGWRGRSTTRWRRGSPGSSPSCRRPSTPPAIRRSGAAFRGRDQAGQGEPVRGPAVGGRAAARAAGDGPAERGAGRRRRALVGAARDPGAGHDDRHGAADAAGDRVRAAARRAGGAGQRGQARAGDQGRADRCRTWTTRSPWMCATTAGFDPALLGDRPDRHRRAGGTSARRMATACRPDGRGGGFGLVAMRQRIEALSGTLQVESEPGARHGDLGLRRRPYRPTSAHEQPRRRRRSGC